MTLKLLMLTDELFPDAVGGIGKSLYSEATALVKRGHRVTVIVRSANPALPETEIIEGIQVRRVRGPSRTSPFYYLFPLVILINMIRALRAIRGSYNLLVVYNPIMLLAAHISGLTRHMPSVYVFYSSITQEIRLNADRGKYELLSPLAYLAATALGICERYGLSHVDTILTRSHFSQDILSKWLATAPISAEIIPVALNTDQYHPLNVAQSRRQLDLPLDRPILITVRRLVARMGLENLVRSMALLREQGIDATLLIAGEGYLRHDLEQRIDELDLNGSVRLLGFVPEEQLPVYLGSADLFVLPTEALEGFGVATIEALAVGLPVIGTPIGATPEILRQIDADLVAASVSPEGLAQSLARWLQDDAGRAALRPRCRLTVENFYQDAIVAEQLERLFFHYGSKSRIVTAPLQPERVVGIPTP